MTIERHSDFTSAVRKSFVVSCAVGWQYHERSVSLAIKSLNYTGLNYSKSKGNLRFEKNLNVFITACTRHDVIVFLASSTVQSPSINKFIIRQILTALLLGLIPSNGTSCNSRIHIYPSRIPKRIFISSTGRRLRHNWLISGDGSYTS